MKKLLLCVVSIVTLLGTNTFAAQSQASTDVSQLKPINSIVAVVNDTVITQDQLDKQFAFFKHQLSSTGSSLPDDAILKRQVLQHMVVNTIQMELATRSGIKVSNAQLNESIANMAKAKNKTVDELYAEMNQYGLSNSDYRKQVNEELAINDLIKRDVATHVVVSDEEIASYKASQSSQANQNTEYLVGDILIALPEAPTTEQIDEAKKKANELYLLIQKGKDFKEAELSQPNNQEALSGEGLGWRKFGELPSLFADQVAKMKVGDVAKPFKAPNGYHIIKLENKRNGDSNKALTDEQIRQIIFKRKFYDALQSWMSRVNAQAYVSIVQQ